MMVRVQLSTSTNGVPNLLPVEGGSLESSFCLFPCAWKLGWSGTFQGQWFLRRLNWFPDGLKLERILWNSVMISLKHRHTCTCKCLHKSSFWGVCSMVLYIWHQRQTFLTFHRMMNCYVFVQVNNNAADMSRRNKSVYESINWSIVSYICIVCVRGCQICQSFMIRIIKNRRITKLLSMSNGHMIRPPKCHHHQGIIRSLSHLWSP